MIVDILVGELRENVPLKSGSKKSSWFSLFSCSEDGYGGSKLVTISFGVLTAAITIALIAQIYYGDYQVRTLKSYFFMLIKSVLNLYKSTILTK